jgi:hypothetical protein
MSGQVQELQVTHAPQHSGQHSGPRGGMLVVLSQHTHPAVLASWLGPCQVRFRNSRFQELPRGVPWLGSTRTAQYAHGGSITVGKKISGANREAAEGRSVPCPHNPRSLWQIFNGIERLIIIEQNEKMTCCGPKYWDFTPTKILEHFGLQSTRETAAKSLTGARA